jgi:hypothetical protein
MGCSVRFAFVLGCALLAVRAAPGQTNLGGKLKELNVRVRTEHYALAGTVNDKTLNDYGRLLETIHREYAATFAQITDEPATSAGDKRPAVKAPKTATKGARGKAVEPAEPNAPADNARDANAPAARPAPAGLDAEGRYPVLVFGTENDYQEFGREFLGGRTEHTGGMFIPSQGALLILDRGNPNSTSEVLFHEAFHQFMHRHIKNPPMWLNEGLADYYGTARVQQGRLVFVPDADSWKLVRKAIEKKLTISLAQLVQADHNQFYDPAPVKISGFDDVRRSHLYYKESYTLIHCLLADQTARPRLRDYMRALAKDDGSNTAKLTAEFFSPAVCDQITPFWFKHVQSRPENR